MAGRARFNPERMSKSTLALSDHLFAGLNAFEPGQEQKTHVHENQDKLYVVIAGVGEIVVGEETGHVGPGDMALAPAGALHGLKNPGPERLVVMVVMSPPASAV